METSINLLIRDRSVWTAWFWLSENLVAASQIIRGARVSSVSMNGKPSPCERDESALSRAANLGREDTVSGGQSKGQGPKG